MKTPLFLLSLFATCGLLAQTDIGIYPSTTWSSTNLLVNRTLETGQVGRVIGYPTTAGKVGLVTLNTNTIPEAPLLSLLYARSNATWQSFPPGLSTMPSDAPNNGLWYSRRNNEWQNFVPGGGSGTNAGGTNRIKAAALGEWRPANTNGTLIPSNTNVFIRLNHIYDPDGLFTAVNTNLGSFKLVSGHYAVTMVVPISVAEQGGGNVRIPFSIGLFNLTTTNDVYYQTYTVYDEDLSQYSQVFMPFLITDGTQEFTIRVVNQHATLDLVAGQAGGVIENRYSEIQILKLDGIAGLPEAPINGSLYARQDQDWTSFTIPSTNGFIPEAPTDGQTYGRRGSDASWQLVTGGGGGAGQDTNAVAAVPDLATLTNSVVGYTKAIVGWPNETTQKLYQKIFTLGTPMDLSKIDSNSGYVGVVGNTASSTNTPNNLTLSLVDSRIDTLARSTTYTMGAWIKSADSSTLADVSVWDTVGTWPYGKDISAVYKWIEVTFTTEAGVPAYSELIWNMNANAATDSLTASNWVYSVGTSLVSRADGLTIFDSAAEPGYGWQQVSVIDSNAVAAVPDMATLTNRVTGYQKAIVGQTNETVHKLFQLVPLGVVLQSPTNVLRGIPTAGPAILGITNNVIYCSQNATPQTLLGCFNEGGATASTRYTQYAWLRANETCTVQLDSSTWTAPIIANTSMTIGTDWTLFSVTYTANSISSFRWYRDGQAQADETLEIYDWRYNVGEPVPVVDNVTLFASATPGYGWQQVSLESPGGGNTVSTQVFDSQADQVVPNANVIICDTGDLGAGMTITNQPSILPGFQGQHIRLVIPNKTTAGFFGLNSDDGSNGTGVRLGTTSRSLARYGSLGLYFDGVMWVESDWAQQSALSAELLPAPWPPPDTNGVQVLPANVKEQLLIELIPYLIANWNRLAPLMTNTTTAP